MAKEILARGEEPYAIRVLNPGEGTCPALWWQNQIYNIFFDFFVHVYFPYHFTCFLMSPVSILGQQRKCSELFMRTINFSSSFGIVHNNLRINRSTCASGKGYVPSVL